MKLEDYTHVIVTIERVDRQGDMLYLYLKGLVLPEQQLKDKNIVRRYQCVAHERNNMTGKYVLHLALSQPELREIMVSTWAKDYEKLLQT